jgi:hypothetical protein
MNMLPRRRIQPLEFWEVLMYLSSEMRVREAIREYAESMSF